MVYLESPSTDPAFNLALEQYVFEEMPRHNEYLMLWQNDKAVIVGKHQNTHLEVDMDYVENHGLKVVRRLSGGGAVFHDLGNVNYSFIVDAKGSKSIDFTYFCQQVVTALANLGVEAEISGRNDITIAGKKFSGNAQYMKKGRVMHHGTIMFDSDLEALTAALNVRSDKIRSKGVQSVRSWVTNVKEHLGEEISLAEFWQALVKALVTDQKLAKYTLTAADIAYVEKLRRSRYEDWGWNFGASPRYSIQKERRLEGFGTIQIGMEVDKGVITDFITTGDYFGSGDSHEVARLLQGVRLEKTALLQALAAVPIEHYYRNLSKEQLVDIILG